MAKTNQKLRVLLEMRPAFDGYSGIPQETRLLFRGLCMLESIDVEGLLQTSHNFLAEGTKNGQKSITAQSEAYCLNKYSRVIISIEAKPSTKPLDVIIRYLKKNCAAYLLTFSSLLLGVRKVETTIFETRCFEDYIWRALFAKTLSADDFDLVIAKNHRICAIPWNILQTAGLNSLKFASKPVYPLLDTSSADIFITQTPYPARVDRKTALVVRYHDAFPVLMPHTVAHRSRHQATHYYALLSNVQNGAYFACVSDATRLDLLRLFPEVNERAVTIYNMVSQNYYEEQSFPELVPQIIFNRLNQQATEIRPTFFSRSEYENFYKQHLDEQPFKYLLMVSTIEPRKNHERLLTALSAIRSEIDPSMKLVVVGGLGWDVEDIVREMRPWIEQGVLFILNNILPEELRLLYHHAAATICPSLGEGFDFSGVESMRSGGIVIASNIPVHREVFNDAAEYFDPYSTVSLVETVNKVLSGFDAQRVREKLLSRGKEVSSRYLPERILPQWEKFLNRVSAETADRELVTSRH